MTGRVGFCVAVTIVLAIVNSDARAQSGALRIEPTSAGGCAITIWLPDRNAAVDSVTVDDGAIDLTRLARVGELGFTIPLSGPLQQGDRITVTLRSADPKPPSETITVTPGVNGEVICPGAKQAPKPADDRDVLELAGFLGLAVDNFAPKQVVGYPESAASTRTRRTFGVIGQYRLSGDAGDHRQLWITGATLNGLRTADIDCTNPDESALCTGGRPDVSGTLPKDIQAAGIQVIEHASTLEAHIGVRYEFATLQRRTKTPAKIFMFGRYGFIDIVDPVVTCQTTENSACATATGKATSERTTLPANTGAFSTYYLGLGGLLPAGSMRDSGVTWGVTKENIYGTGGSGWTRQKLTAIGFIDVMPQLGDFSVGKWLGFGHWRAFLALDVDRDMRGRTHGPDTIEIYMGFAFDAGRAIHL